MTSRTAKIPLSFLVESVSGKIAADTEGKYFESVTTDSRDVRPGMLFVALKGENFDGNQFVESALLSGAAYVLAEKAPAGREDRVVIVPDSLLALGAFAAAYRQNLPMKVVGVTGSVGKTTTKEFIYAVLNEKFRTHKTDGNHNNHIGLPMSLLEADASYEAGVYEMGMNHKREIAYLTRIVRPDVAVITNIGTMHIGNLGSREAICEAKLEILEGLPEDGSVILNGDEPLLQGVRNAYYVAENNRDADMNITHIREGENGSAFDLTIRGERVESIVIPTKGRHNVFNAALAYAVGSCFGMGEFEIRRGLMNFRQTGMRQKIYTHGKVTVMEDCYNAGPESVKAALGVLCDIAKRLGGRAVAVLGEMRELGDFASQLHQEAGRDAAGKGVDRLFIMGSYAQEMKSGAMQAGMPESDIVVLPNDYTKAAQIIAHDTKANDTLLFKASRALRFETLLEAVKTKL
ncbi:MAG: UDP-N-acetylmuramoyl-tripeptide--D-alanyl-D-alanine ligase [Ruminococcaceae bacterium]|nr:UDP-N-acetylmuramoyl-tripeptide--D-alanyl-D-alanine ligase [Oscillospiraceae bacterium]